MTTTSHPIELAPHKKSISLKKYNLNLFPSQVCSYPKQKYLFKTTLTFTMFQLPQSTRSKVNNKRCFFSFVHWLEYTSDRRLFDWSFLVFIKMQCCIQPNSLIGKQICLYIWLKKKRGYDMKTWRCFWIQAYASTQMVRFLLQR